MYRGKLHWWILLGILLGASQCETNVNTLTWRHEDRSRRLRR